MKRAISALALSSALAIPLPALAETIRPMPRPHVHQISATTVIPAPSERTSSQMTLLFIQATSFVSAASMVTGTPLFVLPK